MASTMRFLIIVAAMFPLTCICNAQNDSFTQVGPAQCSHAFHTTDWQCPQITFSEQFGGTPSVIVSIGGFIPTAIGGGAAGSTSITPRGFLPVIAGPANPS